MMIIMTMTEFTITNINAHKCLVQTLAQLFLAVISSPKFFTVH